MLATEFIHGQGLGNQLFCYVTTRMLAHRLGYDFGIGGLRNAGDSRVNKKGFYFMNLEYGKEVPDGLTRYDEYRHAAWTDPQLRTDIRLTDKKLLSIPDNTIIYGNLQSEEYFGDRLDLVKEWLKVKEEYEHTDTNGKNICVMNFRGGDMVGNAGGFVSRSYWINAIDNMLQYNPNMEFCIVTDDVKTANAMLPEYPAYHEDVAWDYIAIKNARNVICTTSTFACFPLWTSQTLEYCIAPKYWFHHNLSQGWWSLGCSIYSFPTYYMDREGNLFTPEQCMLEWEEYKKTSNIYMNDF
jgi:hypothetical protein